MAPRTWRAWGYGFGPCRAESGPCSHPRRRWPVDLPDWDDMLVPALCFSTQLSLSGTQMEACHMLWRTGKCQHPLLSISRGHSVSIPALSPAVSWATLDDLQVPPNVLCVFDPQNFVTGARSVGLLPLSPPTHTPPQPAKLYRCSTFQARGSVVQASFLDPPPRLLHHLPRSDFAEHAVVYVCSCLLPAAASPPLQ